VGDTLSTEILQGYNKKKIEFDTENRTYCSNPSSSAFLVARLGESLQVRCPACRTATCSICKGATHEGPCPVDRIEEEILTIAALDDWKKRPRCGLLIDRVYGCNGVTVSILPSWHIV